MKKLKLDLDTLAVESYATQTTERAAGTVAAHSDPVVTTWVAGYTVAKTIEWSCVCI
ncbi:MAG TPA: hypothetical protein VFJ16_22465 [Longimicrobium sp.]|nr:hypothetical protein [Longimicrobium sp.]